MDVDAMMQTEIAGKGAAVAVYDGIIWKIRAGYAAAAYGGTGALVSLGKSFGNLGPIQLGAFVILIIGLTLSFAATDFKFVESKLRVVQARDRLIELCAKLSLGELKLSECQSEITALLKNAGEKTTRVNWRLTSARQPLWIIYGVAPLFAIAALVLLTALPVSFG